MSAFLGILVGLVLGLTGAGGSILAVPMLVFFLGWPITQAATTGLLAVSASATLGTVLAWPYSYVRYRAALLMAATGMLAAPLGLRAADLLPAASLELMFAGALCWVAWRMLHSATSPAAQASALRAAVRGDGTPARGGICRVHPQTGRLLWTPAAAAAVGSIGAATGFLSGLLGVGGGFVIVPALRAVSQLSMQSTVATSLMAISITSLGTVGLGLIAGRPLPLVVALPFVLGALAGMALGRVLAPRLAGASLQRGFALAAGLAAIAMAAHGLGAW